MSIHGMGGHAGRGRGRERERERERGREMEREEGVGEEPGTRDSGGTACHTGDALRKSY